MVRKLIYSKKANKYQHYNIKPKNLKNYIRVKITTNDRKKQPQLLKRKRTAYIKTSQENLFRNMHMVNFIDSETKDTPVPLMELRLTKINNKPQDLEKLKLIFKLQEQRLLRIFSSIRGSLNKGILKRQIPQEIQTTISQAMKHDSIQGKENNKPISYGELKNITDYDGKTHDLNYLDKTIRLQTPQFNGWLEYPNEDIEQLALKKGFEITPEGYIFVKTSQRIRKRK